MLDLKEVTCIYLFSNEAHVDCRKIIFLKNVLQFLPDRANSTTQQKLIYCNKMSL